MRNPNDKKFSTGYQEGNIVYKYNPAKFKMNFNVPDYLQPIIWKKTQEVFRYKNGDFNNSESFPICCTECKKESKDGIWAETFYICKSCSCVIMSYFEQCFF